MTSPSDSQAQLRLQALYEEVLRDLSAERLVRDFLQAHPACLGEGAPELLALGKAALGMCRGAVAAMGTALGGVAAAPEHGSLDGVEVIVGEHPLPGAGSERAGRSLLERARSLPPEKPILFLVSGGGSALAAVPAPPAVLADKVAATRRLLRSGASIDEINVVRKHLSLIKGGQLWSASGAKRALCLILSDVVSGALDAVASGPTLPDTSTYADALEIVRRHQVTLPEAALARLALGAAGRLPETPRPGDEAPGRHIEHQLLASPEDLRRRAVEIGSSRYARTMAPARLMDEPVERVAERITADIAPAAASPAPGEAALFVYAGEPSVRVTPKGGAAGKGGRMQHLALLLAEKLAGLPFTALCAGSDGRDGDTQAAGAVVDGQTRRRAQEAGIDLRVALERFDSAGACAKLGIALPAFLSGTNLTDIILVEAWQH